MSQRSTTRRARLSARNVRSLVAVVVIRPDGTPRPCLDSNECACEEQPFVVDRVIKGPGSLAGATVRGQFYPGRAIQGSGDDRFIAFVDERVIEGSPRPMSSQALQRLRVRNGNVMLDDSDHVQLNIPDGVVPLGEFVARLQESPARQ